MKRRLVLLTACLLIFLTACSGEEEMKSSSSMDEAEIVSSEPAESQEEIKEEKTVLKLEINGEEFTASLEENSTVDALCELLKKGPLTLTMSDYANMEKGADLGTALPRNDQPMNTRPGDIILYQGRTLVIYYDTNSWSLTPIGKIKNVDESTLRQALGTGDVSVTLWLEE